MDNKIKLSPLVRLSESFFNEMKLDDRGVFNSETYEKYLERQQAAEEKSIRIGRSQVRYNAFLFLVTFGQSWELPLIAVEIGEIPAVQEILIVISSLCFFFLCFAFVTDQCYRSVLSVFGNRIVNNSRIDPDFFNASRSHFDFALKIFRPKLNIWATDFFEGSAPFKIVCKFINSLMSTVLIVMVSTHFLIIYAACQDVIMNGSYGVLTNLVFLGLVVFTNVGAIMLCILMFVPFTFTIVAPTNANAKVNSSDQ